MTPLLSVVVPVFNGGPGVAENVETIRHAVARRLGEGDVEVIVVSDGSIDGTESRLLEAVAPGLRVIHYDRNLGKGYAVKAGILAARGAWIGICDVDLDLDPAALPDFLEQARDDDLDLAVGSKRHPGSIVTYPASRQVMSWLYQQLNRVLFGLSVRDTQVGMKVMSREVADDVVPLLLVKRFAFDLELLAVAHALGHTRIRELPIRLDYRFTGSGVGARAVIRALWDTASVFYRLRVLRTYQRKRQVIGTPTSARGRPTISLVRGDSDVAALQDYPVAETATSVRSARGELVAILEPGARPAGNWLSASVAYFNDPAVVAVVCPTVAPLDGPLRSTVAATVLESRLGGGFRRQRYFPGNLRNVTDFPTSTVVLRRSAMPPPPLREDRLVHELARRGRVVYTPETMVVAPPPPALAPLLRLVHRDGGSRGQALRQWLDESGPRRRCVGAAAALGLPLLMLLRRRVTGAVRLACAAAIGVNALVGAVRFRSPTLVLLAPPTLVLSRLAYLGGFVRGLLALDGRRSGCEPSTRADRDRVVGEPVDDDGDLRPAPGEPDGNRDRHGARTDDGG
jgi:glycosyltransferase involved in cell wall biosynthesis